MRLQWAIAICFYAVALGVSAQSLTTVGDLLDKGGKKLSKDEIEKEFTGATVRGVQAVAPRRSVSLDLKPDGTATGHSFETVGGGNSRGVFGKWRASEQGQLCLELSTTAKTTAANCTSYFRLGDKYYTSVSDDRESPVHEREVRR